MKNYMNTQRDGNPFQLIYSLSIKSLPLAKVIEEKKSKLEKGKHRTTTPEDPYLRFCSQRLSLILLV